LPLVFKLSVLSPLDQKNASDNYMSYTKKEKQIVLIEEIE